MKDDRNYTRSSQRKAENERKQWANLTLFSGSTRLLSVLARLYVHFFGE